MIQSNLKYLSFIDMYFILMLLKEVIWIGSTIQYESFWSSSNVLAFVLTKNQPGVGSIPALDSICIKITS